MKCYVMPMAMENHAQSKDGGLLGYAPERVF